MFSWVETLSLPTVWLCFWVCCLFISGIFLGKGKTAIYSRTQFWSHMPPAFFPTISTKALGLGFIQLFGVHVTLPVPISVAKGKV